MTSLPAGDTPTHEPDAGASSIEERTGAKALIGGGTILAVAMLASNGGNYLLNLLLGRWLTPAEFADANLMVTLMLLVTAIAVALQLVSARYAGIHQARGTDERADAMAAWLNRGAVFMGVGLALFLGGMATVWAGVFNTESAWPFVILAVGMPAYLTQSVRRGVLQGRLQFKKLAVSFVVEMVARVSIALALVAMGYGVSGATVGLSASFVVTWLAVRAMQPLTGEAQLSRDELGDLRTYIGPVAVLLIGQIIINNGDVLVVKGTFAPDDAGVYSAIALIGRAVFFLSWSAVTTLFPAVAQREESGASSHGLLIGGVVVVSAACGSMTLGAALFGDRFFTSMFGPEYAGVSHLLTRYAIATSIFAVGNLIVTHQLSLGRSREAWVMLGGAALQTVLLLTNHASMNEVVWVQVIAMSILLASVTTSLVAPELARARKTAAPRSPHPLEPRERVRT